MLTLPPTVRVFLAIEPADMGRSLDGLGACLADDMGLGKTLQVLALLLLRKREKDAAPAIVVLPASLLGNWKTEIERFAPTLSVKFLHPAIARGEHLAAAQRNPKRALDGADAVFTTYGMPSELPRLRVAPLRRGSGPA